MAFQSGLTPVLFYRNPENYTGYQGFTCINVNDRRNQVGFLGRCFVENFLACNCYLKG